MMRKLAYSSFLALALLVGCAQLGVPAPKSFEDKAAVVVTAATSLRQTANTLLKSQHISVNDAISVQEVADHAVQGIDVARSLQKINPNDANAKLDATLQIMQTVQDYLVKMKGN